MKSNLTNTEIKSDMFVKACSVTNVLKRLKTKLYEIGNRTKNNLATRTSAFPASNIIEWILTVETNMNGTSYESMDSTQTFLSGYERGCLLRDRHLDLINQNQKCGIPSSAKIIIPTITESNRIIISFLKDLTSEVQTVHRLVVRMLQPKAKSKRLYLFLITTLKDNFELIEKFILLANDLVERSSHLDDDILSERIEGIEPNDDLQILIDVL